MAKRPKHQNGLSKKELLVIIEKIDSGRNQMKSKKPKTKSEDNSFYSLSKFKETR